MKVTAVVVLAASCVWGFPQRKEDIIAVDQLTRQPRNTAGRIVGGWDAAIEDFPYQVAVLVWGIQACGGSIISENWVLTAAHCMLLSNFTRNYSVRAGSSLSNSGGVVVSVASYYTHPSLKLIGFEMDYDFCLFLLSSPLPLGPSISVIALPNQNEDIPVGATAMFTGWGHTQENGRPSIQLQALEVSIISDVDCNEIYQNSFFNVTIHDSMICAGYLGDEERGPCQQDSGGPLAWNGMVIGVASFANGCARPGYPAVYARVSHVRSWIREVSGV